MRKLSAIWVASSRVGDSTSTRQPLRGAGPTVGGQAVQDRQREGRGLAGSRLRDAEEIGAREDGRDGLGLDGSGRGVAFAFERLEERRGEAEFRK